jgi:hypothetical protein
VQVGEHFAERVYRRSLLVEVASFTMRCSFGAFATSDVERLGSCALLMRD